jgi:hypothetical protein
MSDAGRFPVGGRAASEGAEDQVDGTVDFSGLCRVEAALWLRRLSGCPSNFDLHSGLICGVAARAGAPGRVAAGMRLDEPAAAS